MALKILELGGEPSAEERRIVANLKRNFTHVACWQGSIAHSLQSMHCMRPYFLNRLLGFEPKQMLYWNMCYGTGVFIYNRPAMRKLNTPYRLLFSAFGGWMFGHSSLAAIEHISGREWPSSAISAVLLGYLAGRCMHGLLEAYLYFVDMSHRDVASKNHNPTIVDFL